MKREVRLSNSRPNSEQPANQTTYLSGRSPRWERLYCYSPVCFCHSRHPDFFLTTELILDQFGTYLSDVQRNGLLLRPPPLQPSSCCKAATRKWVSAFEVKFLSPAVPVQRQREGTVANDGIRDGGMGGLSQVCVCGGAGSPPAPHLKGEGPACLKPSFGGWGGGTTVGFRGANGSAP